MCCGQTTTSICTFLGCGSSCPGKPPRFFLSALTFHSFGWHRHAYLRHRLGAFLSACPSDGPTFFCLSVVVWCVVSIRLAPPSISPLELVSVGWGQGASGALHSREVYLSSCEDENSLDCVQARHLPFPTTSPSSNLASPHINHINACLASCIIQLSCCTSRARPTHLCGHASGPTGCVWWGPPPPGVTQRVLDHALCGPAGQPFRPGA